MKLATIIIGLLLISALFLTACQQPPVDDAQKAKISTETQQTPQTALPEDVDLVAADEVSVGEMI